MRFRKKPIIIEAFQMTERRRWDNSEWPSWLHEAWNRDYNDVGSLVIDYNDPEKARLLIHTLEGMMTINWGDWIIQGVQGELYPCKNEIFLQTYEVAE